MIEVITPRGHTITRLNGTMSLWRRLRHWLIRRLAGKMTVAINVTIRHGGFALENPAGALLLNNHVFGSGSTK